MSDEDKALVKQAAHRAAILHASAAWGSDEDGALINLLIARIEAQAAEIEKLREALLDHNDALRSANSIAAREGAQTNWATFREKCAETLEDYHDLTNQIRKDAGEPVYAPLAALGETK